MNYLTLSLTLLLAAEPDGGNWPGFRGHGDGISSARKLPVRWSEKDNLAWKAELPGYGQSSPVVWKERVFVTCVAGAERDKGFVSAFDLATGKKLWTHEFAPAQKARWSNAVSRAAPTPVVDAQGVVAFFEGGDLLALSHEGKPRWHRNLVKDFGEFQGNHGIGSSPAQTDDAVVVLVDHAGPSYLLAVDKKTGTTKWKAERPSRTSWTSPVVATHGGQQRIIISSNGTVTAYDGRTGKLLWEMSGLAGNTLPSASVADGLVLVGSGAARGAADPMKAARSNCCLKLVETDGKPGYELRWQANKASASYATPLAHRGFAYFVTNKGVVYCLDLATGEEKYSERIDGACWASPIAAGDHLYFFGRDGRTTVLKAGPTFERVASNALWAAAEKTKDEGKNAGRGGEYMDPILYGVAAVDGAFVARTGSTLFCIGRPEPSGGAHP